MSENNIFLKAFLSITVILDSINGYISMYHPGILEQVIPILRAGMIIYFIYKIGRENKRIFFISYLAIIAWLIMIVIRFFLFGNNNVVYLIVDIIYISKLLYFSLLAILLLLLTKSNKINREWLIDIVRYNAYLMPLLIIIPSFLGLGRQTYLGSGFGNSGFFIANNSTNIVLIILSVFMLYSLFFNSFHLTTFIFLFLSQVALVIQGSKTSLVFVALEFLFIALILLYRLALKVKIKTLFYFMVSLVAVVVIAMLNIDIITQIVSAIQNSINSLLERQVHLAKINTGIVDTIFSGRITFLLNMFNYLKGFSPIYLASGFGLSNLPEGMIVEMDVVDIVIREGIIGFLMTYGLFIYLFKKGVKTKFYFQYKEKTLFFLSVTSSLLLFSYSIFAGHVFVDIISSTFLAIFLILPFTTKFKLIKENEIENFSSNTTISNRG